MTAYNKSQLKKILQNFVTYSDYSLVFKEQIQADNNTAIFVYFTSPTKSITKNRFKDVCVSFIKAKSLKRLKNFNRR